MPKKTPRVKEQVMVYLDARDRALLEELAAETGLPRTELFRRGLRRLAEELQAGTKPGASLDYLVATSNESDGPTDVAAQHDAYLYGGGYTSRKRSKRARPR
jgi:hypothetical protein